MLYIYGKFNHLVPEIEAQKHANLNVAPVIDWDFRSPIYRGKDYFAIGL